MYREIAAVKVSYQTFTRFCDLQASPWQVAGDLPELKDR